MEFESCEIVLRYMIHNNHAITRLLFQVEAFDARKTKRKSTRKRIQFFVTVFRSFSAGYCRWNIQLRPARILRSTFRAEDLAVSCSPSLPTSGIDHIYNTRLSLHVAATRATQMTWQICTVGSHEFLEFVREKRWSLSSRTAAWINKAPRACVHKIRVDV